VAKWEAKKKYALCPQKHPKTQAIGTNARLAKPAVENPRQDEESKTK
jgi:hypothetical protein